jgi:O-antigen ligase
LDAPAALLAFGALLLAPLLGIGVVHSPRPLAGLLAVGIVGTILLLRPRLGIYILVIGGFWDYFYISAGFAMFGSGDLFAFAVLPTWILRVLARRKTRFRAPPYFWLLGIYIGLALTSMMLGVRPASAYGTFVRVLTYIAAMLAVVDIARDLDLLERVLWLMVFCAVGHAVLAFYVDPGTYRLAGIVEQPNVLGMLMAFGAIPAAGLLQIQQTRAARLFLAGALAVVLVAALLTISRGTYIGLALAFGWWMRSHRRALIIGGLGVGMLLFVGAQFSEKSARISERMEMDDSSVDGRKATYFNALRAIGANPLMGVGFGQFQQLHHSVNVNAERGRGSHSFYLGVLAASGIPAALALFGFVGLQGLGMWRRQKFLLTQSTATRQKWILAIFQAMFIYHGVSLMVRGAGRIMEWIMLGLYIAAMMLPEKDEAPDASESAEASGEASPLDGALQQG